MRIGIDARFYGPSSKGLGRYSQKLIENLEKISNDEDDFFVYLRKENWDEFKPKKSNFKKVLADYPWYSLSEQWNMPRLLNRYKLDLVHFPHFNVPILYFRPFIVTIHDLILLNFPTIRATTLNPLYYWIKFLAYRIVISLAIKRSLQILTVSNFTKKDILDNYSVKSEKIIVTYEAAEVPIRNNNISLSIISEKYGIIKPYILYVGNAYPHKNLEKLIISFQEVIKEKPNLFLVLVGKKDYFYNQLIEKAKQNNFKNIIFTGQVSDNDLEEIYNNSEAYIFPSLYEGFGLPPLEAMARNIPVISSNHESLKEILGDSVYFFNATNSKNISQSILRVVSSEELKSNLRGLGKKQVEKYSWLKMAKETNAIYHQIKK